MDLHEGFDDWLVGGAEGDPPRDLAVHASGCDACLRSLAAVDSLQAIDIGGASMPPLGMVAAAGTESLTRTLRYAVGAVAVVLLGTSVAIGASGLLRPTQLGADDAEAASPGEGVLAGVPSANATSRAPSATPSASASDSPAPSPSPTAKPPAAGVTTAAPIQILPHTTPSPDPPDIPEPTAEPTPNQAPTAAPTATPIVTPSPSPSVSPSIVVPTPTPTPDPTPSPEPTPAPACSNGIDDDGDTLIDFGIGGDPGCTSPDDPSEEELAP